MLARCRAASATRAGSVSRAVSTSSRSADSTSSASRVRGSAWMAWVMTATCPSPTVPSSSAAPSSGSRAGTVSAADRVVLQGAAGGADPAGGVPGGDPQGVPQQHPGGGHRQLGGQVGVVDLPGPPHLRRVHRPADRLEQLPDGEQLRVLQLPELRVPQRPDPGEHRRGNGFRRLEGIHRGAIRTADATTHHRQSGFENPIRTGVVGHDGVTIAVTRGVCCNAAGTALAAAAE